LEESDIMNIENNEELELLDKNNDLTKEEITKEDISNDDIVKDETMQESDSAKKKGKKQEIIKEIKSYICIVIAAVVVAVVVNTFLLSNTRIPTGSMENTINCGDRLFGNRLAYKTKEVERKDVIIFKFPDNPNINYIKRVIGLPGEEVLIEDGKVYINGELLEEDYLKEDFNGDFGPYNVPKDSYFVMGDNRNNSNDARFWENTYVHKDAIIAKAIVRYYPGIKFIK
jgi:signal peptidase I